MNQLRCAVIDDEPLASGLIASYIRKTPFLSLEGEFASPNEAAQRILAGEFDVVFLDIEMPQLNGIEFARLIPESTKVIFTTAYDRYAVEGFRVNALDYLLKPISYEEFLQAAGRALKWHEQRTATAQPAAPTASEQQGQFIIVKSEYKLVQIATSDILFIEGLKDYVRIYLSTAEKPVTTLLSMKALESTLPMPPFMRVHRSYIVNTSRISVIERNRIVFGRHMIPVSDSYRQTFADFIAARTLTPRED